MTYTIPSDAHNVGDNGHTSDHNNIADCITNVYTGHPDAVSGKAYQVVAGAHDLAPGMAAWLTTLGNRHYLSGTVACIGTSITAGNGATTWERSWPVMLQTALNNRFPSNGLSHHGRGLLIPKLPSTGLTPDYVTITGSPSSASPFGFNRFTYDISAGGGCTLTYHLTGTTAYIATTNQPGGGSYTYKVDSGSPVSESTSAGSIGPGIVGPITLDAVPGNAHTFTITYTAASGACGIDGVYEYNGDEAAGLQVYNCGSAGSLTSDWTAMNFRQIALSFSRMYLIELGTNDWGTVSVATFQANLGTILSAIVTACAAESAPVPQFVLVAPYNQAPGPSSPPWSSYVAAMYAVAAARTDTTVLDLTLRMPESVTGGGPYGEYASDGVHPSDIGHSVLADILCSFLGPQ